MLYKDLDDGASTGFYVGLALVLTQVCCSVFAGVYNEKLLKSYDSMHIMVQNAFMYANSIACNAVVLGLRGDLATAFSSDAIASINVRRHIKVVIYGIILYWK